jgi:hypothetical protein
MLFSFRDQTMNESDRASWLILNRFVEIRSPWVTFIGEHLQDDTGKILDYWRVEKEDSVIIIPIQNQQFLFPIPMYRPGVGETTLDFPGGRVPTGKTPLEVAPIILKRELGITENAIECLSPINKEGWAINSSFSNQKLYGFVTKISQDFAMNPELLGTMYRTSQDGISTLLNKLTCLQCRSLLLEFLRLSKLG